MASIPSSILEEDLNSFDLSFLKKDIVKPGNLNLCNLILHKVKDFNKAHSYKIRSNNNFE